MSAAEKLQEFEEYPILEAEKIQSIIDLADGDDEFLKELTDLFFERAPILLGEIKGAYEGKDAKKFERSSHALKGTSGNLGAMKMMKICETLERMGRENELPEGEELISELEELYKTTEKELKNNWL